MAAGFALYAASLLLELPGALLRLVLGGVLSALALGFVDPEAANQAAGPIAFALAGGPLLWSLTAFAWPGSGALWRWRTGGRAPSERERDAYEAALEDLAAAGEGVRAPRSWFVLDDAEPHAAIRGRCVMVTRGLLYTQEFEGVLAHELGHLNSLDGRLTEALGRLAAWRDPLGPGIDYAEYTYATAGRGDPRAHRHACRRPAGRGCSRPRAR